MFPIELQGTLNGIDVAIHAVCDSVVAIIDVVAFGVFTEDLHCASDEAHVRLDCAALVRGEASFDQWLEE